MKYQLLLGVVASVGLGLGLAGSAQAAYLPGDYWQASRDWTANTNPDGDFYGTADVWAYQYNTNDADFNPANHSNLTNWTGSLWNVAPSGPGYYTMVNSSGGGHPDMFADPIRTWTSPVTGNVRISGALSRGSANGDGVRGYIHQETAQLWTGDALPAATSTSYDLVTRVEAGDRIAFRVNPISNHTSDSFGFNPKITNMGTVSYEVGDYWRASEDWTAAGVTPRDPDKFGTADVWRYQYNADDADFNPDNHTDMPNWTGSLWNMVASPGPGYYSMLHSSGGHPDNAGDSIRTWTSPVSGTVRLTGTLSRGSASGTNGVIGYIHREQDQLWNEIVPVADSRSYDITTKVRPGDRITFRVNPDIDQGSDSYGWNPRVELTGAYGLIGEWKCNEGTGTAYDSSGANYGSGGQAINFTNFSGSSGWTSPGVDPKIADELGSSLRIHAGEQIYADRSFEVAVGHKEVTVDFWFRYEGSAEADHSRQFLVDANGAVHVFLERAGTPGDYYWAPRAGSHVDRGGSLAWATATGTTRILPEQWYHMAMTYDGSQTLLYLDGQLEGVYNLAGTMNPGNKTLRLGLATADYTFDGQMDYIRLWDYALSPEQIFANYESIIPEPSALVLLSLGVLVIPAVRRRRRR